MNVQAINEQDLRTLFICSFRYCLGRKSYMPSLIQSIIMAHKKILTYEDLVQLDREIDQSLNSMPDGIDKEGWLEFQKWAKKEADLKKNTREVFFFRLDNK